MRRAAGTLALALAAVASAAPLAAASPTLAAATGFAAVPAGSVSGGDTTWATSLSGKEDGHFDRFWQLFVESRSSGKWALRTPPGVATNGGLAVASNSTGTEMLTGFGPSQDLTFSPLALSSNGGARWTPGGLTSPLATPEPSVLALGPGGRALAVSGGAVLVEHGSLTTWRPLVTGAALRSVPEARSCGAGVIVAVGFDGGGSPIVGTSCQRPGSVGMFSGAGGRWSRVPVAPPRSLGAASITVVRISGASAIFGAVSSGAESLFAAWPEGSTWSSSPLLHVDGRAIASGTGAGQSVFVVTQVGQVERASIVAGPGRPWRVLPVLPSGTTTIAVTPGGATEALVVAGARFSAWRLGENGQRWTKVQSLTIPLVYGSSD